MKRAISYLMLSAMVVIMLGCRQMEELDVIQPNMEEKQTVDLSSTSTANCYIVPTAGAYKFKATHKGNSMADEDKIEVDRVAVLWESFGTATALSVGDLVKNVQIADEYISFEATASKGNAVIAAYSNGDDDTSNTDDDVILWSWHIWLTDNPAGQVYANNAGTMMDRNLGATSATASDGVATYGLLYQWGRKDPFLGSGDGTKTKAVSAGTSWPNAVSSSSTTGTIEYTTQNPMQFISYNSTNYDWYYPTSETDYGDYRWYVKDATSGKEIKTIYDPCPPGWRVPGKIGDYNTIWQAALQWSENSQDKDDWWNDTNKGMNMEILQNCTSWVPAAGYLHNSGGSLGDVGDIGCYWSAAPDGRNAYCLYFISNGYINSKSSRVRAYGHSVRCLQE